MKAARLKQILSGVPDDTEIVIAVDVNERTEWRDVTALTTRCYGKGLISVLYPSHDDYTPPLPK